jgi:hypothetical protein
MTVPYSSIIHTRIYLPVPLRALQNLSIEMEAEEKRVAATELLTTLASTFGAEICRRSVVPSVSLLSADPSVDVRKSIALNLHKVYKAIRKESLPRSRSRAVPCQRPRSESRRSEEDHDSNSDSDSAYNGPSEIEASNMLISVVIRLSNDPEPLVRMASAESMVEISNAGGRSLADGPFLDPYSRLLDDPSDAVRAVAMKQIGFFISSLSSSQINEKLLHHFTSLVNDSLLPMGYDMGYDSELCYHCAYTFPGVFQAVGVDRWSELREVSTTFILHFSIFILRLEISTRRIYFIDTWPDNLHINLYSYPFSDRFI